jgi:hypothetical protein
MTGYLYSNGGSGSGNGGGGAGGRINFFFNQGFYESGHVTSKGWYRNNLRNLRKEIIPPILTNSGVGNGTCTFGTIWGNFNRQIFHLGIKIKR